MKTSETFGRRLFRARRGHARPLNVGLMIPMSGTLGIVGPSAYACARLARETLNAGGGIDGREVRLTLVDSSETSASLEPDLDSLIATDAVDALVVLSNTAVCRRIGALVDARVPLIYTPHFEGEGLPEWVHAIGETPARQLQPALGWITERYRPRRWYLLGNDYSWPRRTHAQARQWLHALGAETVGERYVPFGERDFDPAIEEIVATRADAVLVSLIGGESVHMCRAFGAAGLAGRVLRLSTCVEENAVLGMGHANTDGLFLSAGYFSSLDSDLNGDFKERYHSRFGARAPVLNSLSQSVYEGFVHLSRQAGSAAGETGRPMLPGIRSVDRRPFNADRDPIFLGQVDGLGIRVIRTLTDSPG